MGIVNNKKQNTMKNYNYIAKKIEGKKVTEYVLQIEELNPNDIEDKIMLYDDKNAKRVKRFILKKNFVTKETFYVLFDDFTLDGCSTFIESDYIFEQGTVNI